MPKIENVTLYNLKNVLGHAVKNRKGYRRLIDRIDLSGGDTVNRFEVAGFIRTSKTQKNGAKWKITDLGDQYYRYMFGNFSYYEKRISGFLSRILRLD